MVNSIRFMFLGNFHYSNTCGLRYVFPNLFINYVKVGRKLENGFSYNGRPIKDLEMVVFRFFWEKNYDKESTFCQSPQRTRGF